MAQLTQAAINSCTVRAPHIGKGDSAQVACCEAALSSALGHCSEAGDAAASGTLCLLLAIKQAHPSMQAVLAWLPWGAQGRALTGWHCNNQCACFLQDGWHGCSARRGSRLLPSGKKSEPVLPARENCPSLTCHLPGS